MEEAYDFKEVEPRVSRLWEADDSFAPSTNRSRRPYSMYLIPPNASGPLHVGNALMIAIQDVLARYHRAKGEPTMWIPGTDHGGYETQVTFEQELEKKGENKDAYTAKALREVVGAFVEKNNQIIIGQTQAMGASVNWPYFRYTLDEQSLSFVDRMFKKMVSDNLVYRSTYMVNYCTSCATVLADIELKEVEVKTPLYVIKFALKEGEGHLSLATTQPELLFATTHMLAHPQDARLAPYIGKTLINPATGEEVVVVKSKRKHVADALDPHLSAFCPSHKRYDFEYALRNEIPTRNLFDWEGRLVERYPGMSPEEARAHEVALLEQKGVIEQVEDEYTDTMLLCKKGHRVQNIIRMSWFVRLDDDKAPLRKPALDSIKTERPMIYPHWREKGLVEWIGKMHDWPIARQNVWGIRIPIWYELTDPALFTVWFVDAQGVRRYGNLQALLDEGVALGEVTSGLERVYAAEGALWTLEQEEGKTYLPETDTLDTWFSSGAWSAMVFDAAASRDLPYFYPNSSVVIGYDLLRLSISREIILGVYMTGKLPFKRVYFHSLLKSKDGQKMSKSLGNAITLDEYLDRYGADVTRMALLSYTGKFEDFFFSDDRLDFYKNFAERLWTMGRISDVVNVHSIGPYKADLLSATDAQLLADVSALGKNAGVDVEKYFLAQAQEKLAAFLPRFEQHHAALQSRDDAEQGLAVFHAAFKSYLALLHPFMPFMTEEIYSKVYEPSRPLAAQR